MTYEQTIEFLYSLQKFGIKFGLSSTENLLAGLGRPHENLPCLHLAGTNGKGSVGAAVTAVLTRAGYRVGFYTSPHLVTFRERFVIGRDMISRAEVVRLVERVRAVMAPDEPPTFFEFVTAMAFLYFAQQQVDLAVLETGMGGRLDATNVAGPLVGVITNISVEHTDYLGRTLALIAAEKAGIIKPGLPVVTGEKRPQIRRIFEQAAQERGARLFSLGRDFRIRSRQGGRFDYYGFKMDLKDLRSNLPGPHQIGNAALALAALELLGDRGFAFRQEDLRLGLSEISWPGRAEIFPGPPDLMLDGAHNPGAAKALAKTLAGLPYPRLHLVLGIMADKNIGGIMAPLLPLAHALYLTRPEYYRSAAIDRLTQAAVGFPGPVYQVPGVAQALEAARQNAAPQDLVLVTGSLFTVGEARAYLTGMPMD